MPVVLFTLVLRTENSQINQSKFDSARI